MRQDQLSTLARSLSFSLSLLFESASTNPVSLLILLAVGYPARQLAECATSNTHTGKHTYTHVPSHTVHWNVHWLRTYAEGERPLLLVIVILADFRIPVCVSVCVCVTMYECVWCECAPLFMAFTARCKCIFISCLCARVFINGTLISDFSPSLSLWRSPSHRSSWIAWVSKKNACHTYKDCRS